MATWSEYKKTMIAEDQVFEAARDGDLEFFQKYIHKDQPLEVKNHKGYTPLMLACYHGHPEVCALLIRAGADVNSIDHAGNSIMMGVAFKGYSEIIQMLLAAGADRLVKNVNGMTALDFARAFGRQEVVRILDAEDASFKERISLFLKMIT